MPCCRLYSTIAPLFLISLSRLIQTNASKDYPEYAGEDYPEFSQPVANYNNGKTQLAQYQDYGKNPRYGKCWTGALARLQEGSYDVEMYRAKNCLNEYLMSMSKITT